MTWRTFASTIAHTKFVNYSQWKLILRLFQAAGIKEEAEPFEKTIRSWLEGRRNCDGARYFPSCKINNKKVFQFFRNIPEGALWNIQREFRIKKDVNSLIDVNTDNLDQFCWSLVKQFLDLLGFPMTDIPASLSPRPDYESIKNVHPYNKCCLYCIHWDGDRSTVGPHRIPTKGLCWRPKKVNGLNINRLRRPLSSSDICDDYEADQSFIKMLKQIGYNIAE